MSNGPGPVNKKKGKSIAKENQVEKIARELSGSRAKFDACRTRCPPIGGSQAQGRGRGMEVRKGSSGGQCFEVKKSRQRWAALGRSGERLREGTDAPDESGGTLLTTGGGITGAPNTVIVQQERGRQQGRRGAAFQI